MTTSERKYSVGVIGIGKMGSPMAIRIAAYGYPLHVYDISEAAIKGLCSRVTTAQAAKTLADIGRNCEVVILMLPDSDVVKRVLFGEKDSNYVSAAGLLAACEALKVGADFGIAPEKIIAVLNASTGKNNSTENKLMQFVVSNLFNSGFSLGLMRKDINIATDLAKSLDSKLLLGEALLKSWADAEAKLGPAADHTEIFRILDG